MPCSQHSPPSVIPHAVKVLEDDAKATGSQERTVFREDKTRPYLANDSRVLFPKSATGSGNPDTFTCRADVLAREPSTDNVNGPSPRPAVEGADIVPYRESLKVSVSLSLKEDVSRVLLDFDGTPGTPSEQSARKKPSPCSGK